MQLRNGVFVVIEEARCPLYNEREEFVIGEGGALTMPVGKPTCLILARDLIDIASGEESFESFSKGTQKSAKFECGGCTGVIRFEFKKDKEFATLQMKLLAAADRRERFEGLKSFAGLLRGIDTFSMLNDDDVIDLASLLELNDYPWQFPIAQKGDPGNRLYILLTGKAEVIDDFGIAIAELDKGEIFGEMSLLTGDRVSTTIMAAEDCKVAVMSQKNFRHILNRFPSLQIFFYKLMVTRITQMNKMRAEELASGLVGHLAEVSVVELCQLVNTNQKSGRLNFDWENKNGVILFNEGEVIHAETGGTEGQDAFYELLAIEEGRFKFTQGLSSKERKYQIIGGFMGLLMEGMRRVDDLR